VVYFLDHNDRFECLDGDRLIVLYVTALKKLLEGTGVSPAVVTTVYANAAVVNYIRDVLQCQLEFTGTGVKNMHPAAAQYDVGVYFESNGHGTVLAKPEVIERVRSNELAWRFLSLSNQTVGDALVDVMLAEASLRILNLTVADWMNLYTDIPAKTTRIVVKDRARYVATPDETRLLQPE
jgi:phosphoacetylglucosamine mutase